jgi:CheY-like chemotaxis protein
MLNKLGIRADVAANGLEVLQALERQPYDIVLMDIQMPEMDGLEAARFIRQRWPGEDSPHIIAVTAHALEGDRQRCLDAGMNDYISKPMRIEELVGALYKYPYVRQKNISSVRSCSLADDKSVSCAGDFTEQKNEKQKVE